MPSAIGNFFIQTIVSSPLHPRLGSGFAVITVEGRKTGRLYSTPINVVNEGGLFTVFSLRGRHWWRNLRGGRLAQLRLSGKQYSVRGEVIETRGEVLAGLRCHFERYPSRAKYFGVRLAADGQPARDDLERAAGERVIIRLLPAKTL